MDVVVVTPRTAALVDMALAKKHLRVEHDDDDDLIELYAEAVTSWLDGPAGWLGRSLGPQGLRADFDASAGTADLTSRTEIPLPYGPVSAVASVTFVDSGGAASIADAETYELIANRVRLIPGAQWPTEGCNRVVVEYTAGHAADGLPRAISAAILLMVGDLYANRETGVIGTISADVKMTVTAERLLTPWRLWVA